jgi:hypothetical protein
MYMGDDMHPVEGCEGLTRAANVYDLALQFVALAKAPSVTPPPGPPKGFQAPPGGKPVLVHSVV